MYEACISLEIYAHIYAVLKHCNTTFISPLQLPRVLRSTSSIPRYRWPC